MAREIETETGMAKKVMKAKLAQAAGTEGRGIPSTVHSHMEGSAKGKALWYADELPTTSSSPAYKIEDERSGRMTGHQGG